MRLSLGWSKDVVTQYLPIDLSLPAVGQGALGIECRLADQELIQIIQRIHDTETGVAVTAERAFLAKIEGGCQIPVAAYAQRHDGQLHLTGLVASPDGKQCLKEIVIGEEPQQLGEELAEKLIQRGGADIVAKVREELKQ